MKISKKKFQKLADKMEDMLMELDDDVFVEEYEKSDAYKEIIKHIAAYEAKKNHCKDDHEQYKKYEELIICERVQIDQAEENFWYAKEEFETQLRKIYKDLGKMLGE